MPLDGVGAFGADFGVKKLEIDFCFIPPWEEPACDEGLGGISVVQEKSSMTERSD
jgi:hypothetical protein